MKQRPKKIRLLLGVAAVLASVLLVWGLAPVLGELSLFLILAGGGLFVWLNPELMGGR